MKLLFLLFLLTGCGQINPDSCREERRKIQELESAVYVWEKATDDCRDKRDRDFTYE